MRLPLLLCRLRLHGQWMSWQQLHRPAQAPAQVAYLHSDLPRQQWLFLRLPPLPEPRPCPFTALAKRRPWSRPCSEEQARVQPSMSALDRPAPHQQLAQRQQPAPHQQLGRPLLKVLPPCPAGLAHLIGRPLLAVGCFRVPDSLVHTAIQLRSERAGQMASLPVNLLPLPLQSDIRAEMRVGPVLEPPGALAQAVAPAGDIRADALLQYVLRRGHPLPLEHPQPLRRDLMTHLFGRVPKLTIALLHLVLPRRRSRHPLPRPLSVRDH